MDGLGRVLNAYRTVDDGAVRVSLRDARAVTVLFAAGTATVEEHTAASAGDSENLDVGYFYTQNNGVWTEVENSGDLHEVAAANDLTAFTVYATSLSDGFTHLSVSLSGTDNAAYYILHDLTVQRDPELLENASSL